MTRMVDGEALAVTMAADLHFGRVPEHRSWTPNLGFVMAAELRKVSVKSVQGSSFLGHEGAYERREAER